MKNVISTIIGIALVVVLIIAVVLPISSKSKSTGNDAHKNMQTVDRNLDTLISPIPGD